MLKDQGNVIADRLGARVTPEVFILDSGWTLRYHGALGNSHQSTKVKGSQDAPKDPCECVRTLVPKEREL